MWQLDHAPCSAGPPGECYPDEAAKGAAAQGKSENQLQGSQGQQQFSQRCSKSLLSVWHLYASLSCDLGQIRDHCLETIKKTKNAVRAQAV